MKKFLCLSSVLFSFYFTLSSVSYADQASDCFTTLKSNVLETGQFFEAVKTLENMQYSDITFSPYYKNMSSFGIDLDEPLLEIRVHSFGKQTSYIHPPYSPFPSSTKSDKWASPAKEFIIAEEYVKSPSGEQLFLSCSFMQISAKDLMQVTSEKYLYDGALISALKESSDQSYKAWYNENMSYDHDRNPFVTWKRLFIYPVASRNAYFDRFSIADSFPAHKVDNFNTAFTVPTLNETSQEKVLMYTYNKSGDVIDTNAPLALTPVEPTGTNKVFPLNSYYQAIQDTFPEFAKHLALRGVIHYDNLKQLLTTKDNTRFAHIWHTVLYPEDTIKYALKKEKGQITKIDKFYEKYLTQIKEESMEPNIVKLINEVKEENDPKIAKRKELEKLMEEERMNQDKNLENTPKTEDNKNVNNEENTDEQNNATANEDEQNNDIVDTSDDEIEPANAENNTVMIILGVLAVIVIGGGIFIFIKKKNNDN